MMKMSRRRVVITGVGPVTTFGVGMDPLWSAMLEGRTGIKRIDRFNPCGFPCKIAAEIGADLLEIRKLVPKSYRKATKVMCRDIEIAVAAAGAAVEDAGLTTRATDPDSEPTIPGHRMGCQVGAGLIAADVNELATALWTSHAGDGEFDLLDWGERGMQNLTPLWLLKYLPNMLACHVTIVHDCRGPSNAITCCEASSGLSVGEALRVIQRGAADACLAGGAESKLNAMSMLRQDFAHRLAETSDEDDPAGVVRPFDSAARGTVIGEGGGILVIEAHDSAEARGARPYAELRGFACTQSFCPDTMGLEIDPDGASLANAIELAMEQAQVAPGQLDAIMPFGSSISAIDAAETAAITRALGSRAAEIPVITTIPNVGNCHAGAGGAAMSVAAMAIREQTLPARLNTSGAAGLNANAVETRDAALNHVLVCTTSQGGQNVAMVLSRVVDQ